MRELRRDFSATTEDNKAKRWELRILPQPLYRYDGTDPDLIDGAVFSFVTSAGTDPEALVVLEARKPALNPKREPVWHYGVARFTDLNIWICQATLKGSPFRAVPIPTPCMPSYYRFSPPLSVFRRLSGPASRSGRSRSVFGNLERINPLLRFSRSRKLSPVIKRVWL